MSTYDDRPFSSAPGVLIAVPQLDDPHFERAVVAMLLHNQEGALGLIINLETDFLCREVIDHLGFAWHGEHEARLLRGGPVDPHGLWVLHPDSLAMDDAIPAGEHIVASRAPEAIEALCERAIQPLIMGIGCAGWGPGQLEEELAQGTWINGPIDPQMLFEWPRKEVWERALRAMGINPHMIATGGGMH